MRIYKIPDQVIRLAIVFAILGTVLVVARHRFIPETFGQLGHYRTAAIDAETAKPIRYAGLQACIECHEDVAEVKDLSYHRGLACEVCHGPAAGHVDDPMSVTPEIPRSREACLHCHEYLPTRPTGFPQIIEKTHNPMEACASCHNPHDPTPPQVPDACSACHASISRTKAVSHHVSLDCETCHETPAAHREDPRANLPRKPVTRDFCGRCHAEGAPGSSTIPRVDLASHGDRYLCWQCHYPHDPEGR